MIVEKRIKKVNEKKKFRKKGKKKLSRVKHLKSGKILSVVRCMSVDFVHREI